MNKYEITFYLVNGEIGHLVEANSTEEARDMIKNQLKQGSVDIADDLVLYSTYVTHFLVQERD